MLFDIRTKDSACKFVQEFFAITYDEFIREYTIECKNDFELFWKKRIGHIDSTNIDNLEFIVFHVTSNNDNCREIMEGGIKNLQLVLSECSNLSEKLMQNGIKFDIKNKKVEVDEKTFDIDYDYYRNRNNLPSCEEHIKNVSRKIYNDFAINGFFKSDDIARYYKCPEFLTSLSKMLPQKTIDRSWESESKGYLIVFRAQFDEFDWFTFYGTKNEYENDLSKLQLKKWLLREAIYSSFENGESCIVAYMKPEICILPEKIIEIIDLQDSKLGCM